MYRFWTCDPNKLNRQSTVPDHRSKANDFRRRKMGNIQDGKTDLESPCPNQEVHVVENKNDCSATIDKLKS